MNFSCDSTSILAAEIAPESPAEVTPEPPPEVAPEAAPEPPAPDPTTLASEALAAVAKTCNQSRVQCKW